MPWECPSGSKAGTAEQTEHYWSLQQTQPVKTQPPKLHSDVLRDISLQAAGYPGVYGENPRLERSKSKASSHKNIHLIHLREGLSPRQTQWRKRKSFTGKKILHWELKFFKCPREILNSILSFPNSKVCLKLGLCCINVCFQIHYYYERYNMTIINDCGIKAHFTASSWVLLPLMLYLHDMGGFALKLH